MTASAVDMADHRLWTSAKKAFNRAYPHRRWADLTEAQRLSWRRWYARTVFKNQES